MQQGNGIKWVSFCLANQLGSSAIHFFPASSNVAAPYPINCKLTLFAGGLMDPLSVVLEGARLRQPDGVRITDAFPSLPMESSSIFGLVIELYSPQGKLDLSASHCIIEIYTPDRVTKYFPSNVSAGNEVGNSSQVLGINDSFNYTTIVVVNGSSERNSSSFLNGVKLENSAHADNLIYLRERTIEPWSVVEIEVQQNAALVANDFASSSGAMTLSSIVAKETLPKDVACYAVYRDNITKQPVSIVAI